MHAISFQTENSCKNPSVKLKNTLNVLKFSFGENEIQAFSN
jgi:hypothetical protein